MSQMPAPSIPKAFLRVPSNPNIRGQQPDDQQPDDQQPQLQPQLVQSAQAVQQPVQQPVASVAAPVAQPVQTPQYVPPRPDIDPMLVRQLEEDRRRLAEESAQKDEAIRNLLMERQQLQTVKTQKELDDVIESLPFDDLGSVDPDDAKRIAKSVLGVAKQNLVGQVEQQLTEQQKALQATYAQQQHELLRRDVEARNREIMRVHPDFFDLQETPEYRAFMSQPIAPHTKLTRDKVAAEEYQRGNTAFVIELLNQLKQSTHSPESIMTVAPVQAASGASAVTTDNNPRQYTLRELNHLYQVKAISHDKYREELAKLRATGDA